MRESERRAVRRAIVLIRSGDGSGAVAALRLLLREAPVLAGPAEQLVLDLVLVECKVGGTIPLRDCLTRRSRRYASGGQAGQTRAGEGRGTGIGTGGSTAGGGPRGQRVNLECIGCPLGEAYAQRAPRFIPPPQSRPPEVLPASQRKAKAGRRRGPPNVQDDSLAVVASMTPDDREV